jgi:tRNA U55 pseudouridine synthase TruB
MYKIILCFFVFVFITSCTRTPEEIKIQIKQLTLQERELKNLVSSLKNERDTLSPQVSALREEVAILEYQKNGGDVEYILILGLRQVREGFDTYDFEADYKDELNATKFEISVDKRTYMRYNRGDTFFKDFRQGSALTEGTTSSWFIYVINKRVIKI